MASISINNMPCIGGPVNGVDCVKYVGLKPFVNQKLVCARPANIAFNRPYPEVRATINGPTEKIGLSDEECEAAVVAGRIPEAPPVPRKPAAPVGTPLSYSLPICRRPRRNRRSPHLRAAFQETSLSPANFVYPLFIHEGEEDTPIGAMPGCYRLGWRHGLIEEVRVIMNDETVHQLCKQAVAQARAGADVVSPSDMMDGRIGAIREALDDEGFQHVLIMSYTAKYASSFYGPFREALESNPRFGDKKTYQMNPANYREALVETREDEEEGADILLVKPGLPYLDIIRLLRDNSSLPIAAYQVSGEYSTIKAGGILKMIDEERVMMESLMCLRRAGADMILTYFALQAARCLCGEKR